MVLGRVLNLKPMGKGCLFILLYTKLLKMFILHVRKENPLQVSWTSPCLARFVKNAEP